MRFRSILPPWGIPALVVLALGWVAVRAGIGPTLPCGDDITFHLLRTVQLDHLWSQGVFYSRLAPDLGWGYGYPIFNFHPAFSYYVALLLSRAGLGLNLGVRVTLGLTFPILGLGVYVLARDFLREEGAIAAAVAAMYAPYAAYNPLVRGALAEALGWALLPWALWAVGRAARGAGRRWWVCGALFSAALLFTHMTAAVVGAVMLALYALMEALSPSPAPLRTRALGAAVALGLGFGLVLFFWLPAVAERSLIQWERTLAGFPGGYVAHLLSLRELFALQPVRPDLVNPSPLRSLGLIPALLALPALLTLPFAPRRQPLFFGGVLVGAVLLTLPVSSPLWESITLLRTFQFSCRFLGPASIALAVLVGRTVDLLPGRPGRLLGAGLATLALIAADFSWLKPSYCPSWEHPSLQGLRQFEQSTGLMGVTSYGEYLPRAVEIWPTRPAETVFDPASLPEGATVQEEQTGPLSAEGWVESPQPFRLTVNRFFYPGWRAWVDGELVEAAPEVGRGRLTLPVPAGRHYVAVRFGETPLRLAADLLSALSLLALALIAILPARVAQDSSCISQDKSRATAGVAQDSSCSPQDKSRATADVAQDSSCPAARDVSRRETAWLLLLPLLVTVMVLLAERFQPPPLYARRLTDEGLRGVPVPARIIYDGQFHLLGRDALPASVPADRPVPVQIYWRDTVPDGPDYRVSVALVDGTGETWNGYPLPPPWHRPPPSPRQWPPDRYATIALDVRPLLGTPPGEYTVTLTVFDGETLLPYTAVEDGRALGPEIPLAQVQLTRPSAAPSLETLGIPVTATMPVWGPIRLLKGTVREQESRPGDPLHLEFYWESLADPDGDYRMRLWVSGEGGREWERPLTRADFPTSQWRAGDRWLGQHTLRLPPGLESGEHELWLQLCRRDGETCHPIGEPYLLGSLRVQAPPRSWTVPPLGVRTDARLGDEVTLLGADWEPHGETLQTGSTLTVTLVWRGEREMETSYRVFLHMLGPDGSLVAQSDGEPAGWARPTTGWLPGEVVVDERVLVLPPDLPPGEYRLMAGMYRYGGPRLTTPDGTDAILLAHFRVR
jgi:hypothetical protein